MKSMKLTACYALASAAVVGIAACAGGTDGGSRIAAPGGASAAIVTLANPQTARLCKIGPVGSYTFDLVITSTYGSDVQSGTPVTVNVTNASEPACTTVLTRVEGDNVSDPSANVVITERTSPDYTLVAVADSGGSIAQSTDLASRSATLHINAFHSAKATFTNEAVVRGGCTYTMGWYKNHTSQWPAGALTPTTPFDGGATLITILNTPPKGSQYIILAHQYITAKLNIQGGASVPSDVQAALNTAAAYFAGGGAGAGDPNVDITGISTILDNYNNGLIGPGHCD